MHAVSLASLTIKHNGVTKPYRDDPSGVGEGVKALQQSVAVGAAQQAGAHDDERLLRLLHRSRERVLAAHQGH